MFDPGSKILVVDDMPLIRAMVKKSLLGFGFKNIEEAVDGVEGWAKFQEALPPFTLIISDWNMPRMDGLEFLKKVRASTDKSKTPFIMLTTEGQADSVVEAIDAGVSTYVIKPMTGDILKRKLEDAYKKTQPGR